MRTLCAHNIEFYSNIVYNYEDMKSFRDLNIKREYKSLGEEQLNRDFVTPVLNHTKLYRRATAYFSSFVLETILTGVEALYLHGGRIQLVMCPQLSKEDYNAILKSENFKKEFEDISLERIKPELFNLSDDYYDLLYELLIHDVIEIKFALTNTKGIYHDKLAIFEDSFGNKISFSGSANETKNAYEENYERVKIFKNYDESKIFFNDDEKEFEELWSDENSSLTVVDVSNAIKKHVIELVERGEKSVKKKQKGILPRPYQQEAVNNWVGNNHNGFFVMATGTGKTYTSCFCIKELFKTDNPIVIIAVPYIHLIAQWKEALQKVITADYFIEVYGANSTVWKTQLANAIFRKKRAPDLKVVIISTIASWQSDYFQNLILKFDFSRLLIIDEAHRVSSMISTVEKTNYKYSLGLSATPLKGRHLDSELLRFFGGVAYNLPIEDALDRGFLCGYNYHTIFVDTTENDERRFKDINRQLSSCFDNKGQLKKGCEEKIVQLVLKRTRLLSMAENKIDTNLVNKCIANCSFVDHFIIYCGDGKVNSTDSRHLDFIKDIFNDNDYKMNRFTCVETMDERIKLIDLFNRGIFHGFVSIRCLDEGIDIPSIKKALILSSGDNFREFVQRRGRILRHFDDKKYADIYDIVLKPSLDCPGIAEIELRRFYEYARLALNHEEKLKELECLISEYSIDPDKIYKYFDTIDEIDVMLEDDDYGK